MLSMTASRQLCDSCRGMLSAAKTRELACMQLAYAQSPAHLPWSALSLS